ncbi:ureidoglycolate hydrolase [Plectosphaerella cucumerina]|jgi:ureidoglycolate lyase|uniref:Ureidoglycolate hydrolase n=1 Tax=Plectosphaerella cucumerina TaxID=40658 RepID=A0A8K0TS65_9PEZI|nr:ureidoglycolate hydrolase [Plectosphaerella cucumerina]
MPPVKISLDGLTLEVPALPLTRFSFAPFGDVIQNPHPTIAPSPSLPRTLSLNALAANQGTAIKYQHPSTPRDLYAQAPSGTPARAVVNMFVCAARPLEQPAPASPPPISTLLPYGPGHRGGAGLFDVSILERHPFTTQTFVPMGAPHGAAYLVIVAPSLPPSSRDEGLPAPKEEAGAQGKARLPGRGLPDLRRLQAYVASGDQAVTYGAGTWHAPMVALGHPGTAIEFVVTQFANDVGIEDCQEVVFGGSEGDGRIVVKVPERPMLPDRAALSKL